jgi:PAS domain S-box-containing protein
MTEPSNPVPAAALGADALRALLDASAMLLASSSPADVLAGIVDIARNVIAADAYAVWRTTDALNWRVLASHGLPSGYRTHLVNPQVREVILEVIPDVSSSSLAPERVSLYNSFGIRSLLVVPLQLNDPPPGGPNAGTITFYWRTPRTFNELEIAYASALANLSSAALNLADLNQQNQRERTRLAFLANASAVLSSSLDYESTLDRVAHLAVPHIADWCTVHLVENGTPNRIVVAHSDPAQLSLAEEYSRKYPEKIVPDRGLGLLLRTGQPEVYPEISDDIILAGAVDEEHLRFLRQLRLRGSILVPLLAHDDKVLGAIRLLATGDRTFSKYDVRLAQDLARRAAAAIENARLHREVLDQENRLRLAHAAAHMGTWSWDLVRNQLFWSDEWKQLHQLPLDTQPTLELGQQLVHPEDRQQVGKELNDALTSTKDLVVFEHRGLLGDGRIIWLHHRARIERDAEGLAVSIMGISMDVTERRQSEDALRRTEKLAAAGRLAATVAHEINNPLASIVNLIYIAKLSPELPEEVRSLLTTAEGELSRTAQIVRQTLGFYRESVHPQQSDIGALVADIVDLYRSRILSRGLSCHTEIQPQLLGSVVPGELKQVVANLVANAVDATPPGGAIRVSVHGRDGSANISVADNGTGITPQDLSRLFEPFFTTKEDVGTGLGLWVSKGIVEKHNGRLTVRTSTAPEVHGTTFTATLPLNPATADVTA